MIHNRASATLAPPLCANPCMQRRFRGLSAEFVYKCETPLYISIKFLSMICIIHER